VDDLNVFTKPDDTGAADQLKLDIKKNIDSTSDETKKLNLQALLRQVPAKADEKTRSKLLLQLMSIVGFNLIEPVANP
jgi:hypothetical protein